MTDLYLRFATRDQALAALEPLGMTYTDDERQQQIRQGSHAYALWEVGEINGYTGWHVNLRMVNPDLDVNSLDQYRVYPPYPVCVWA